MTKSDNPNKNPAERPNQFSSTASASSAALHADAYSAPPTKPDATPEKSSATQINPSSTPEKLPTTEKQTATPSKALSTSDQAKIALATGIAVGRGLLPELPLTDRATPIEPALKTPQSFTPIGTEISNALKSGDYATIGKDFGDLSANPATDENVRQELSSYVSSMHTAK